MSNFAQELRKLRSIVSTLEDMIKCPKTVSLKDSSSEKGNVTEPDCNSLSIALRKASNGGLIKCLPIYPAKESLMDLKLNVFQNNFTFTLPFPVDGDFTNFINTLQCRQDKIFIDVLNSCTDISKQETSTVYKFDEKSFTTVRYLVERHRRGADYILLNRVQLSDMVRDQTFLKQISIKGSRELLLEGLVGNIDYTKFKTTAGTVIEEAIAPETIYALDSTGTGYHTHIELNLDSEMKNVEVVVEVTITIDPKSVAKLTIFTNV